MKTIEFTRVFWTEWAIEAPYERRKMAELTIVQFRQYQHLVERASLTEGADYAKSCHLKNLIKYANCKRVLP